MTPEFPEKKCGKNEKLPRVAGAVDVGFRLIASVESAPEGNIWEADSRKTVPKKANSAALTRMLVPGEERKHVGNPLVNAMNP